MKTRKFLTNLRHEIIGYKARDPFEVLEEYNDEKCQKLFMAMFDYFKLDEFLTSFYVDMFLFGKSARNIRWDLVEFLNKNGLLSGTKLPEEMRNMTKEEQEIWNKMDKDISETVII